MMTSADFTQIYAIAKWQAATKPKPYHGTHEAWQAVAKAHRKINTYRRYVGELLPVTLPSGEEVEPAEYLASAEPQPEAVLIAGQLEAELRACLTPLQNRILTCTLEGYQQKEIAEREGLAPYTICRELKIIQNLTRALL